jgi:ABC-type Fe3+/spermidine/putrescine transport system ATPase subunit
MSNLLPGRLYLKDGQPMVDTAIGGLPVSGPHREGPVTVLIRPDEVHLNGDGACQLEGKIRQRSFRGSTFRTIVDVRGVTLTFDFPSGVEVPQEGEAVHLGLDPEEAIQVLTASNY